MEFGHCTYKWIDFLTPLDVLIGVTKHIIREEAFMTFDIHDHGRLNYTLMEIDLFSFCLQKEVKVVANMSPTGCYIRIHKR